MSHFKKRALYSVGALINLGLMSYTGAAAAAEASASAPATVELDEILVTARKRDESIVDVPLAITVVGSEKMEQLGITSTTELANFVPGLQFSDFTPGNSRNDRGGNRPIIFRGLNLARNGGVTGAGSMFLDGAAVIGNEIPGGYDIGAVEVLRGPQNVYFGRASMTGAVSYRTAAIPKELGGAGNVTIAERDTRRFEVSLAGPIVGEALGFRLTGLYDSRGGYITNAYAPSGPKLGARSRESVSGTLNFKPIDALEIKLYANYFTDEDGVSATVNIFPDSPTGTGAVTNCFRGLPSPGVTAKPTICGEVPDISHAIAYSRTDIPIEHANSLFSIPFLQSEKFKRQAGMQRNVLNSHSVVDFDINDYLKAQSITGYHTNAVIQVVDGAQQPIITPPTVPASGSSILYFGLYNKFTDVSQEFRLSSDPARTFSWTAGVNYVRAKNYSTFANTSTTNPVPPAAPVYNTPFLGGETFDVATTRGYFAGGYLKLFDNKMTVSAEARYQTDARTTSVTGTGPSYVPLNSASDTFYSFNPRLSVDYDVGGGKKVYASYAEGGRPGGFNNGLLTYYNRLNSIYTSGTRDYTLVTTQITQLFGVTDPAYKEEKLKIVEFGFKGYLAGGKGYFDLNTYYGRVDNQQIAKAIPVAALGGTTLSVTTNAGVVDISGLEATGNYNFTPDISLNTTLSYNKAKRKTYNDPSAGTIAVYGFSDFSGKELPNAPKISGSAVLAYEQSGSDGWSPFGNVALVYRGKQWADIGNFAYIPGRATVDLRIGGKNEKFRVEAFVTNLFNNKTYPGGNVAPDFGGNPQGQYSGFFGAYADPRTFGVRFSSTF